MKCCILSLAHLAAVCSAAPALNPSSSSLASRSPGDVRLCTETDLEGTCADIRIAVVAGTSWKDNCRPLPSPYIDAVGSVQLDRGALCRLYDAEHPNCTGSGLAILEYPGKANLFEGVDAGHRSRFISCVTCTNCQG